jgi:hypothetical protein
LSLTQKLDERGRFAKVSLVRLGLTIAYAQVSVGWKEIYAVVERSPRIGIQMRLPCIKPYKLSKHEKYPECTSGFKTAIC